MSTITKWIAPQNPYQYDLENALKNSHITYWRQSRRFHVGDEIYIYISKDVREVRYKFVVEETDISINTSEDPFWLPGAYKAEHLLRCKIRLLKNIPTRCNNL